MNRDFLWRTSFSSTFLFLLQHSYTHSYRTLHIGGAMFSPAPPQSAAPPIATEVSLEEIVFSCDICQATVSDVYATTEKHKGFHSGSSEEDHGIVTKLWIAECLHIFCGKHLDGGGECAFAQNALPYHPLMLIDCRSRLPPSWRRSPRGMSSVPSRA